MGDSDDEYNRRRGGRDKFMKERSDFQDKRRDFGAAAGAGGDRRTYGGGQNRVDYKQFRGSGRPDASPPMKRIRRDWDESGFDAPPRRDPPDIGGSMASGGPPTSVGAGGGSSGSHPSMMTFKQFLTTQDDSISDEDAIQKYQDYKLDFKRQQLHSFFIAHKDEEWFRLKYHPEDSAKRKIEQQTSVQRRAEVFQELFDKGWMDKGIMDHTNGRYLIKLMDAVVVKLEGGTDEDLSMLDKMEDFDECMINETVDIRRSEKEKDEIQPAASRQDRSETMESGESLKRKRSSAANEEGALSDSDASDKGSIASEKSKSSAPPSVEAGEVAADRDSPTPTPTKNENDDNVDNVDNDDVSKKDKIQQSPRQSPPLQKMMLHKTASIFLRNLAPSITRSEVEALCKRFPGFLRVALAEPIPDRKFYRRGWISFRRDVNIKEICWNLNNIRLKDCDMGPIVNRDLTRRIRTVNGITIHKQVAQNDLRLAARLVQIYDKKYGLFQNDPTGNDDRKPYEDNGFGTMDFNVASKNPLLKNITDYLIEEASAEEEELLGTASKVNEDGEQKVPIERDENLFKVLDRILLYLRIVHSIDYYNHGEYPNEDEMPNRCGLVHVRGPPLSPAQYGQDEKGNTLLESQSINEFCKMFESRLQPLLSTKERITDDEAEKLGRKDAEKEVEAFINANCQELAKDKWLCPLSGKKFKGPEFVRKHVTNKHGEKLDEVRVEVVYFNNYLYDAKRPGVPDPKPLQFGQPAFPATSAVVAGHDRPYSVLHDRPPQDHYRMGYAGSGGGGGGYYRQENYGGGYGGGGGGGGGYRRDHYQRRDFGPSRNYGGGAAGGGNAASARVHPNPEGRRDPRVPVAYTDLDAPEDVY